MNRPGEGAAPDRWIELQVKVDPPERLALAAYLLMDQGATGVEERSGTLITHQPWSQDPAATAERLRSDLARELSASVTVDWTLREHRDWTHLWKQGLGVRSIGRRVVVKPTWVDHARQPHEVVVEIDPGMAFGTAEHATTRGCLLLLDEVVSTEDRVLDVGTGSAILAIAAVGLGASEALALDADPLAVDAARENVERNAAHAVTVRLEDVSPDTPSDQRFDVVVANMISSLLLPRLSFLRSSLAPGGFLVVGGVEVHEREAARAAITELGLLSHRSVEEDGWWSACFRAP